MTGRRLTVAAVVLAGATICLPLRIAFWLNGSIDRNLTDLRDDVDRGVVALWAEALAGLRLAVSADRGSPAVDLLIADHVRYHRAMAWLGGGAFGLLVAATGWVWRSRQGVGNTGPAPAARRVRTALGLTCAGLAAFAIFFGVVTAANVSTVLNPRPTLASAF